MENSDHSGIVTATGCDEQVDRICKRAAERSDSGVAICREFNDTSKLFRLYPDLEPYVDKLEFPQGASFTLLEDKDGHCYFGKEQADSACVWGIKDSIDLESLSTKPGPQHQEFLDWVGPEAFFPIFGREEAFLVIVFRGKGDPCYTRDITIDAWLETQLLTSEEVIGAGAGEDCHRAVMYLTDVLNKYSGQDDLLLRLCEGWPVGDLSFYFIPKDDSVVLLSKQAQRELGENENFALKQELNLLKPVRDFPIVRQVEDFFGSSEKRFVGLVSADDQGEVWICATPTANVRTTFQQCLLTLTAAVVGQ